VESQEHKPPATQPALVACKSNRNCQPLTF